MLKAIHGIAASSKGAIGGVPYIPDAVHFNGTSNYLRKLSALTGAVDNTQLTVSYWIRMDVDDTNIMIYRAGDTSAQSNYRIYSQKTSTNGWYILFRKSDGSGFDLQITLPAGSILAGNWYHIVASVDITSTATRYAYLNGVSGSFAYPIYDTAGTLDWTTANNTIGWWESSVRHFDGSMSEFYLTNEYIDLSILANREKFIKDGKPVDLGIDGSNPTGTSPLIYIRGDATVWNAGTNSGSGGNFTANGTLIDSANEPVEV